MSIMIWDETSQAFKEPTDIKKKINDDNIWSDCDKILRINSSGEWEEKYALNRDLLVTRDILNSGSFVNVTPTYLSNCIDGTDGFTIVGRASNTYRNGYYIDDASFLRWDISLDLTNYSQISWYAKKNANHGVMLMLVTDGLKYNDFAPSAYEKTKQYAGVGISYNDFPTSWTKYTLDISSVTGTHIVSFIGGYTDNSGYTSSSTSYCNIIFHK